jgi:hypothetical protein
MQVFDIYYTGGAISSSDGVHLQYTDFSIDLMPLNVAGSPQSAAARATVLGLMWVCLLLTLRFPGAIITAILLTTFCAIGITPGAFGAAAVTDLSVRAQRTGCAAPQPNATRGGEFPCTLREEHFVCGRAPHAWTALPAGLEAAGRAARLGAAGPAARRTLRLLRRVP